MTWILNSKGQTMFLCCGAYYLAGRTIAQHIERWHSSEAECENCGAPASTDNGVGPLCRRCA